MDSEGESPNFPDISPRVDFATLFQLDAVRDVPGSPTRV
jgi:hypothetical protein